MGMIEPNVEALLWFAIFALVTSAGFYVIAGVFPLATRPDLRRLPLGVVLIVVDVLLLVALAGGSIAYGVAHLRWSSLVIVAGLALLFAPALLNVWPHRLRDRTAGLVTLLVAFSASLGVLQQLGTVFRL
jgi:hypothetical protein